MQCSLSVGLLFASQDVPHSQGSAGAATVRARMTSSDVCSSMDFPIGRTPMVARGMNEFVVHLFRTFYGFPQDGLPKMSKGQDTGDVCINARRAPPDHISTVVPAGVVPFDVCYCGDRPLFDFFFHCHDGSRVMVPGPFHCF